ncbi:MAG TPA: S1/P1 nuclease [Terriglobia bacterium]
MNRLLATLFLVLALVAVPSLDFGWGPEGHRVVVILAEQYMRSETLSRAKELLGSVSLEDASLWADEYAHSHPETGSWHYINIPLADSKIDLARECPNGACVVAKTEKFLAVLADPESSRASKAEALRFVIHFVGDLHQPLHCADDGDRGGNTRQVIFGGRPDNLHWVWDTGLLQHINGDERSFSRELQGRITDEEQESWKQGSVADWALEAHRLAQTAVYRPLGRKNPAVISSAYERQADPVVELQLERAGTRLAYVLDQNLTYVPAN